MNTIKVKSLGVTDIVIDEAQATELKEQQMVITLDNELILIIAEEIKNKITGEKT